MKKAFVLLTSVACLGLTACVAPIQKPESEAILAVHMNATTIEPVVKSTVQLLESETPPSTYSFYLLEPQDVLGQTLVASLRTAGYPVTEIPLEAPLDEKGVPMKITPPEKAQHLLYVFDPIGKNVYRWQMQMDEKTYGTVFVDTPNGLTQTSPWTRK